MRRFMLGVIVGMLLAAGLAVAADHTGEGIPTFLKIWTGEGRRAWLYYAQFSSPAGGEITKFYECKPAGAGKVTAPPPKP